MEIMKRILQLVRNQMYLALRQTSFWIGAAVTGGYAAVTFLYDCIRYWGYDRSGIYSASELFLYSTYNPFWFAFSMLSPFLGLFVFSMQPAEVKKNHGECYMISRVTKKEYYVSGAICSVLGTFLVVEVPALISAVLYRFTFAETGNTFHGAKYSIAYWKNLNDHGYHIQELYISHPWMYNLLFSVFFAVGCSIIAFFFFSCGAVLKKDRRWLLLSAGIMSFVIIQASAYSGYDIYGDIVVSAAGDQSGIPMIALGCLLIITGVFLLRIACGETEDE